MTAGAGGHTLQTVAYDRGGMGMMSARTSPSRTVAVLDVPNAGASFASGPLPAVPQQPPPRDLRQSSIARRRDVVFGMGMGTGMGGGMRFTVDGREFGAERTDQAVRLGTVEEWRFLNDTPMDHPIHLYVWPMQVVAEAGVPVSEVTWRDVVNLPALSEVTVRIPFEDFAGRTVYHCHILHHEDRGMVATVQAS